MSPDQDAALPQILADIPHLMPGQATMGRLRRARDLLMPRVTAPPSLGRMLLASIAFAISGIVLAWMMTGPEYHPVAAVSNEAGPGQVPQNQQAYAQWLRAKTPAPSGFAHPAPPVTDAILIKDEEGQVRH